jgi:hypothetical protein
MVRECGVFLRIVRALAHVHVIVRVDALIAQLASHDLYGTICNHFIHVHICLDNRK